MVLVLAVLTSQFLSILKRPVKEISNRGRAKAQPLKITCCSYGGPRFGSQNPHKRSQPSVTPLAVTPMPSDLHEHQTHCYIYIHAGGYSHTKKTNKSEFFKKRQATVKSRKKRFIYCGYIGKRDR